MIFVFCKVISDCPFFQEIYLENSYGIMPCMTYKKPKKIGNVMFWHYAFV